MSRLGYGRWLIGSMLMGNCVLADSVLMAPRQVAATSTDQDWTQAENLVNGSGMSGWTQSSAQSLQGTDMSSYWRAQVQTLTARLTFDLGAEFPVGGIHIWNYNETGQTDRGVKDVDVSLSKDGDTWTQPVAFVLGRASGVDDPGTRLAWSEIVTARYIRCNIGSNHGDEHFTGLSEVRVAVPLDKAKGVPVSSLDLTKAEQEYGRLTPDRSVAGSALEMAGTRYGQGLGGHAPSRLQIRLGPGTFRFTAEVGVDDFRPAPGDALTRIPQADGAKRLTREVDGVDHFTGVTDPSDRVTDGAVVFRVFGDGRELWNSGVMKRGMAAKPVDLDVRDVDLLALVAEGHGGQVSGAYADWANAELQGVGPPPVAVSEEEVRVAKRRDLSVEVAAVLNELPAFPGRRRPATDWLVDDRDYRAGLYRGERPDELVFDNGLVSRVFKLSPNAATTDIYDHMTGRTLLRGIKPEATLQVGAKLYNVGGLDGQPEYGYLDYAWLDGMTVMPNAFVLTGISSGPIRARLDWARVRRADRHVSWPPKGIELAMHYGCPELPGVEVTVHYNLYDGIPLFCKWFTLKQGGEADLDLRTYQSDLLALTEHHVTVNEGYVGQEARPQTILFETDYAFGGSYHISTVSHSIEYTTDPQYSSQVNYARTSRLVAVSRPEYGTHVLLKTGETLNSHRTWELITDSYDRERRSLAQRRMYRTVAPWVTENPSVLHVRSADEPAVKKGIDDCAAVGFDTVILTFGSGADIEDMSRGNLDYMKKLADYAKSKEVEIGGYSLLASSWRGEDASIVSPETGKPGGGRFGNAPCLDSEFGDTYFANLRRFHDYTGFSLFEHDGSYPGDRCASTRHHHRGAEDSQWEQFKVVCAHYRWCLANNVYMNVPDWYFMNGSHKCAMHYRESNFSLPRERHTLLARRDIFDGTWEKTPSMGWMHVPLVTYHGGRANAVFEPLAENLAAYRNVLLQNFLLGVQGHYRGTRLYDTEETKAVVKGIVDFYTVHWDILNSDLVHWRRPNGRTLDGMLHVNPRLDEKGALVLFNPTGRELSETLTVPLYYTGLTDSAAVIDMNGNETVKALARDYTLTMDVTMPPGSVTCYLFEDRAGHLHGGGEALEPLEELTDADVQLPKRVWHQAKQETE